MLLYLAYRILVYYNYDFDAKASLFAGQFSTKAMVEPDFAREEKIIVGNNAVEGLCNMGLSVGKQ